jgi:hypothetical protein
LNSFIDARVAHVNSSMASFKSDFICHVIFIISQISVSRSSLQAMVWEKWLDNCRLVVSLHSIVGEAINHQTDTSHLIRLKKLCLFSPKLASTLMRLAI